MIADASLAMSEQMHIYREKELQWAAVRWMCTNLGYSELAADFEATGDRMDTLGWIAGQLIAIEVKPTVHGGMVWYREGRSGLLEAKLAATVGGLYRCNVQGLLATMLSHWDRTKPPLIGVLAGRRRRAAN
jgi:hypothetical protein